MKCPSDGTLHYAEESSIGKTIRCRTCGKNLTIEVRDEPPVTEIEPPLTAKEPEAAEPKAEPGAEPSVKPPAPRPPKPEPKDEKADSEQAVRWTYAVVGAGLGALVVVLFAALWWSKPSRVSGPEQSAGVSGGSSQSSSGDAERALEERAARRSRGEADSAGEGDSGGALPPCARGQQATRLTTGERIEPDGPQSGQSNIQVMNGSDLDAAVRLVDSTTGKTERFVYVAAGHTFALEGIQTGSYLLRFELGSGWITACRGFLRHSVYGEFSDPLVFLDGRIRFYTVTLSTAVGANTRTRRIGRARFLQGD